MTKQKFCPKCKNKKDWNDFYINKKDASKRKSWCISCERAKNKTWSEENPERVKELSSSSYLKNLEENRQRRNTYYQENKKSCLERTRRNKLIKLGITEDDITQMTINQEGKCLLCKQEMSPANIDHCHKTGKVRGLLCGSCNRGLGLFKDNPDILRAAAHYIESNK